MPTFLAFINFIIISVLISGFLKFKIQKTITETKLDEINKTMTIGDHVLKEGDFISVSGHTGEIFLGKIPLKENIEILARQLDSLYAIRNLRYF